MVDAQLEGANLGTFDFESAQISGSTDAHTILPDSDCQLSEDGLHCIR